MVAVILQSKNGVNCIMLARWIWPLPSEISRSKVNRMSNKTDDCSERLVRLVKTPKIQMIGEDFFGPNQRNTNFFFLLCVMGTEAPLVHYHFNDGWIFRLAGSMQVAQNSNFWSGEVTQCRNLTRGNLFGFKDWMCLRFGMFCVILFCLGSPLFALAFVVSVYGTLYIWGSMFCIVYVCRFLCIVSSLCCFVVSVGLMWRHRHDTQFTEQLY